MKHLTSILDKVASELQTKGLTKLAMELDSISNTLDASANSNTEYLEVFEQLSRAPASNSFMAISVAVEFLNGRLSEPDFLLNFFGEDGERHRPVNKAGVLKGLLDFLEHESKRAGMNASPALNLHRPPMEPNQLHVEEKPL